MKQLLLIFLGGGAGSLLRYGISRLLNNQSSTIPFGTLAVNCIGSLLIGVVLGYSIKTNGLSSNQIAFLAIGFCGGFTTFSTFTYENTMFLKAGDLLSFFAYTTASMVLGILFVVAGLWLVKFL
ncbi:fluoride efflux transporter CrcB [Galbibacter sp.]|jgi:CrcB protein|uniref:fluoride efflux transporter CrcB n=1 Tax=Galbibacter sp. TaxID=2918471 RepID=UPI003A920AF8